MARGLLRAAKFRRPNCVKGSITPGVPPSGLVRLRTPEIGRVRTPWESVQVNSERSLVSRRNLGLSLGGHKDRRVRAGQNGDRADLAGGKVVSQQIGAADAEPIAIQLAEQVVAWSAPRAPGTKAMPGSAGSPQELVPDGPPQRGQLFSTTASAANPQHLFDDCRVPRPKGQKTIVPAARNSGGQSKARRQCHQQR